MRKLLSYDELVEDTYNLGELGSIGDFQCDQTGGFPTVMFYSFSLNCAWLELCSWFEEKDEDYSEYERGCREWGVHCVYDESDVNRLLRDLLGKEEAWNYELDESEDEDE